MSPATQRDGSQTQSTFTAAACSLLPPLFSLFLASRFSERSLLLALLENAST